MKNFAQAQKLNYLVKQKNQRLARWLFAMLFGIFVLNSQVFAQTATQNFGTTATSFSTANGTSTTFIPNPTGSGSTYVRVGGGSGSVNLVTASNPLGTSGAYMRAAASSSGSVVKATPILNYTASTQFYSRFVMRCGTSAGASGANNGEWSFYIGSGAMFNDVNDFSSNQTFAGLRFQYGSSGALTLNYRRGSSWSTNSLTASALSQATNYTVEIVGNNAASGNLSYYYNGSIVSVAPQTFDLYINGALYGNDLNAGQLASGNSINAATFIGTSSTSNAANIFVDDLNVNTSFPGCYGTSAIWSGTTSTDWNVTTNWCNNVLPTATSNVFIPTGTANSPVITAANAVANSVTVQAGATLSMTNNRLLTISNNGSLTNNGTFTAGTGTVVFAGGGAINGTLTFNNITLNGGVTFSNGVTVGGNLQLNTNGFVNVNSPRYTSGSTLTYNTGGTYNRLMEWSAAGVGTIGTTFGYPNHIVLSNNTTLNFPNTAPTVARACEGNLTINAGSALYMDFGSPGTSGSLTIKGNFTANGSYSLGDANGGDLIIGGNYTEAASGVTKNYRGRAVIFNGAADQVISRSVAGTVNFTGTGAAAYFIINKTAGNVKLSGSPATDVIMSQTTGNVFQILNTGGLDLNGRTFTVSGNEGNIFVSGGSRTITSAPAGGVFSVTGTKTVTNASSGLLVFAANVIVRLSNGLDCGNALTTVNGTLEIVAGGFVNNNRPPFYGTGSILLYNTGNTYGRGAEWSNTSGVGYPNNVTVNNGSGLDLGNGGTATARQMSGNLTINGGFYMDFGANDMTQPLTVLGNLVVASTGQFSLSQAIGGDFVLRGNWTNNGGAFTPNNRLVTFNGTANQSITKVGGEVFDFMTVNKTTGDLNLSNAITCNQTLTLTFGKIVTGANHVIISSTGGLFGGSSSSYIVGNLRRHIATGSNIVRFYPIGDATNYSPVNATLGSVSTAGFIKLSATGAVHPNLATAALNNARRINRYWSAVNSSVVFTNASIEFNYVASDLVGGAVATALRSAGYLASAWSYPVTTGAVANRFTANNISNVTLSESYTAAECGSISLATTTGTSRCGMGTVTLSASTSGGQTIDWYAALSGGSALASGTTSFTTPSISATTTYYTETRSLLTGCPSSSRAAVVATIIANPAAPAASNTTRCGEGALTLTATAAGGQTVDWYANSSGGTALASGTTSFTTPVLNATTTYYAESRTTTGGCVSVSRTPVNATISEYPTVSVTAAYCTVPGNVVLAATAGMTSYAWSTGQSTASVNVDQAGTYSVIGTNAAGCGDTASINVATELVTNGSFSAGNTGFTTNYTYVADINGNQTELYPEGTYAVVSSANLVHNGLYGKDRNNGTGNILVINGDPTVDSQVWSQNSITVQPNTTYYFSAWALSTFNSNNAVLRFTINGNQVGSIAYLPNGYTNNNGPYNWVRFFGSWNSGPETNVDLSIINLNTVLSGNDFALDDISFGTLAPVALSTAPTVNAGGGVCQGAPLNLQANAVGGASPFTYAWSGPGGFTSNIQNPQVATVAAPANAGSYTLQITDAFGCTTSQSVSITVSTNPLDRTLTAVSSSVCEGAGTSINLSASETGVFYQLRNAADDSDVGTPVVATGGIISLPTGNLNATTTFYVVATKAENSCTARLTNEPTVTANPTPELQITNQALCSGTANLTLPAVTAGSTGGGTLTYWTNAAATVPVANPASVGNGTYYIKSTAGTCTDIEPVAVIISSAPVTTFNYSAASYCSSGSNPIPTISGSAGVFTAGAGLVFANNNIGEINLAASTPGTYTVTNTITPAGACAASSTNRTVTITAAPVASFEYASNSFCQSITSINPSPSFLNGGAAGTFSSSSGLLNLNAATGVVNIANSLPGNYAVVNTRAAVGGCAIVRDTNYITINPYSFEGSVSSSSSTDQVCAGDPVTLNAVGTTYLSALLTEKFNGSFNSWTATNTSTGGTPANAAWTLRDNGYNSDVTFNSNDNSRMYVSHSRNQNGTVTSTLLRSPAMSTVGYSSLSLNFWHYFRFEGRPNEAAKVEVSTNGVTWNTLATYTSNQGASNAFTNVSINLNAYVGYPVFYVRFNYYSTGRARYWAIDNVTISGQTTNYSYNWASSPLGYVSNQQSPTLNPTNNAFYILTAANTFGCEAVNSPIPVTVKATPQLTSTLTPPSVCSGSTFTYTPVADIDSATYSWTRPAVANISNAAVTVAQTVAPSEVLNSTSSAAVVVNYPVIMSYNGCSRTQNVSVTVNPKPNVSLSSNVSVCNGTGAQLGSTVSNSVGAITYAWSPGATLSDPTLSNPVATPTTASQAYTLTVTDANNCSATSAPVTVTNLGFGGTAGLWTGSINSDWNECRNWADGRVPSNITSVIINQTASNDCEISGLVNCQTLTLQSTLASSIVNLKLMPNAQLNVSGNVLINSLQNTANVELDVAPNASIACNNFTMDGSSSSVQNAKLELTSPTSMLMVNGNMQLGAGSYLDLSDGINGTNDGNIQVKGNVLINCAASNLEIGDSRIVLNGNTNQNISSPVGATFHEFVVNKPGGNLVLESDLRISNKLTLTQGKIDLNERNLFLGTATQVATVDGGNANSYIISWDSDDNGTVIHNVPSNSSIYFFPLGDASNYTPFEVNMNSGTLSNATITGKVRPAIHPALGVSSHFINRFWTIEADGITNPNYDVQYTYAESDVNGADAFLFPLKFSNGGWQSCIESASNAMIGNGSVVTSNNTLVWTGLNSFSEFTGSGSGNPLPIELLTFTADPLENEVQLAWTTASEINNSYFTIERSTDGVHFEEVVKQDGAGNSNGIRNYDAVDNNPYLGVSYYRLKQTDFNGDFTYSDMVPVNFLGENRVELNSIYADRANGTLTVRCTNPANADIKVEIFDVNGRLVLERAEGKADKNWNGTVGIAQLSSASYLARIWVSGKPIHAKFIY